MVPKITGHADTWDGSPCRRHPEALSRGVLSGLAFGWLHTFGHRHQERAVQVRDVMTREVVTVGPDTSTKYAAEVMAERGFAALPVVDDHDQLVGIVAETDVLRDRLPADPRLHARRDRPTPDAPPSLLVHEVMTAGVRTVEATDDVSDIARLFVDDRLRSVPVLEHGRLAGIVSRRDLLRMLMRPDADIRADVLRLVEGYT